MGNRWPSVSGARGALLSAILVLLSPGAKQSFAEETIPAVVPPATLVEKGGDVIWSRPAVTRFQLRFRPSRGDEQASANLDRVNPVAGEGAAKEEGQAEAIAAFLGDHVRKFGAPEKFLFRMDFPREFSAGLILGSGKSPKWNKVKGAPVGVALPALAKELLAPVLAESKIAAAFKKHGYTIRIEDMEKADKFVTTVRDAVKAGLLTGRGDLREEDKVLSNAAVTYQCVREP